MSLPNPTSPCVVEGCKDPRHPKRIWLLWDDLRISEVRYCGMSEFPRRIDALRAEQAAEMAAKLAGKRQRELAILKGVCIGLTQKQISRCQNMSIFEVRSVVDKLRRDANAKNRVELAMWAVKNGYFKP